MDPFFRSQLSALKKSSRFAGTRIFPVVLFLFQGHREGQHDPNQAKGRQGNQGYHEDGHRRLPKQILNPHDRAGGDDDHRNL